VVELYTAVLETSPVRRSFGSATKTWRGLGAPAGVRGAQAHAQIEDCPTSTSARGDPVGYRREPLGTSSGPAASPLEKPFAVTLG